MHKRMKLIAGLRAQQRAGQLGMTLMEIMIVLAIIAVVMGFLVGPRVFRMFSESKVKTAQLRASQFVQAHTEWSMNNSDQDCPSSLSDLTKYMDSKETEDSWGKEWVIVCGEEAPEGVSFGVVSMGPDKKRGTDDDINSWEIKKKKAKKE